ncbi:murein biosynthesis integral membrane protein MurJ [Bacillus infantis]|uniref:murein biosynthesis integral membrane protein MurJ n=1 Tax=Bacillus infantis TaxID=324767 RepID=UPI003CF5516D
MNNKRLLTIIGTVAAINLISRFFGFFREVIIGFHFGTSYLADSIITAYTIPNFLYVVAGGAITTAFISVYNKVDDVKHRAELRDYIFTYSFIVFALLSLAFFAFPQWWIHLFFPGLKESDLSATSNLYRIMGPASIFLVMSMYFSGLLNVDGKFRVTAAAPLLNNIIFILLALILFPFLKEEAYAWGAMAGASIMAAVLVWSLSKGGGSSIRFRLKMAKTEYAWRFLKISLPILLGGATLQFYFLLQRVFASSLPDGYLSALNYSSKLVQLPQAVLMAAVTTVIYPLIAKKISLGKFSDLSRMYSEGIQYLLFLMIPFTIFIYIYAEDTVKFIFEYGSFSSSSTIITSELLKILVFGMFAHAANLYVTRFFYAMEKAFLPVISGIAAVFGLNVLVIVFFIDSYGAEAIAWGTTISAYFQLFILMIGSKNMLKLTMQNKINIGKQLMLVILLFVFTLIYSRYIQFDVLIINLGSGFAVAGGLFLFISKLLNIKELEKVFSSFSRKKGPGR